MKNIISTLLIVISIISNVNSQSLKNNDEDLQIFANHICMRMDTLKSSGANDAGKKMEDSFLKHLGITRSTPDYKLIISKFWNENSERLICYKEFKNLRTPQHWMKRVVDLQMYKKIFYDWLLYDEDEWLPDVNAIEIYNGKEETLLDYLDNILGDPKNENRYDFSEIKLLREVIIDDYGAKKASELKN